MDIKLRKFTLIAFVATFLAASLLGCGQKDEPAPVPPPLDACAANKDWDKLNEAQRAELCSKCPRCGVFKPSEPKKW
jgi:entry exclusion lipoprotein TrbK